MSVARKMEMSCPSFFFFLFFFRSVAENKTNKNKTLSRTWESLRLVCAFSSSNWHPSSCENLRWRKRRLLSSHFSLLHLWEQNRQRKKLIYTELHWDFCVFVPFLPRIPIVTATKMITATPSTIARALSNIDRRPYFLAPSASPVWRTVLD